LAVDSDIVNNKFVVQTENVMLVAMIYVYF